MSEADGPVPAPLARLEGADCALRQLGPVDYDWVYATLMAPGVLLTHRFGGRPPSPEQFASILWSGVATQFVIHRPGQPTARAGLVSFYNHDAGNGTAWLSVLLDPEVQGVGWPWQGVVLAIDHVFRAISIRKLCIEIAEWNVPAFGGLERFGFRPEGVQVDHLYLDGRHWDVENHAVFRPEWERVAERLVPWALGTSDPTIRPTIPGGDR
jgi:hypothetical protein